VYLIEDCSAPVFTPTCALAAAVTLFAPARKKDPTVPYGFLSTKSMPTLFGTKTTVSLMESPLLIEG
jgi:hypothetical protein